MGSWIHDSGIEVSIARLVVRSDASAWVRNSGRFGVFQYLTLSALAVFGIARDQGLIFDVLLHLVTYLSTVLFGAYGLYREKIPWKWVVRKNARVGEPLSNE